MKGKLYIYKKCKSVDSVITHGMKRLKKEEQFQEVKLLNSIFEILMLICFGAAWPFSIYKSYTSKSVEGKSPYFLLILILGYICGILNKVFYNFDKVFYLYVINLIMVSSDFILYLKNSKLKKDKII